MKKPWNHEAKVAEDVDAEIAHHIELRARRFIDRGMPAEQAWAEARRRFGPPGTTHALVEAAQARENRMHWSEWLDGIAAETRYAVRQLRRSPGFAFASIITLALGIGANATMFGAIDRLLLQPPAGVVDPGTVVTASVTRTFGGEMGELAVRDTQRPMSYPMLTDLARSGAFEHVAAYRGRSLAMGNGMAARLVRGMATTSGYFATLGARPTVGRFFTEAEADEAPGGDVVVLSDLFWRREFGGAAKAVGQTIELAGKPFRIIGVAPPGFTGVDRAPVELWLPMTAGITAERLQQWQHTRESFFLTVIGRVKRGLSLGTAAQMAGAAMHAGYLADGFTLAAAKQQPGVALVSALPRDAHGGSAEARVVLLIGAVALLVLILACANVANLQLARAVQRRREIAVRLALGVARRRLLRQLALDGLLLALLGGIAGIALAYVGSTLGQRSLVRYGLGEESLVDGRVLAFTAVLSMLCGLLTGLVPALQTARLDLTTWLRAGAREGGGRSSRTRFGLLVLQASLTVILLGGTGMFLMSLRRVQSVRLGLDPDRILSATVVTTGRVYTAEERRAMYDQLLRSAVTMPGVESAALATSMPFESSSGRRIILPGRDSVPTTREGGPYSNAVSSDFFRTMGTRILAGRAFSAQDRAGTAPVVIVNETAARLWWPSGSAVGRCIKIGADSAPCAEVVGVAENARRFGIIEGEAVQFYAPLEQLSSEGPPNAIYVRPSGDAEAFQERLQRRLQGAAPGLPYVSVQPLADVIAPRMQSWRMGAIMFGVFGALAIILASVGLYGVLAYDVAQRQQEIGVRLALGASRANVARLVMSRGFRVVGVGGAIGLAVTLACGRLVEPLLFRTSPYDPWILGAVGLLMVLVSAVATLIPTARATRVDPSFALRNG